MTLQSMTNANGAARVRLTGSRWLVLLALCGAINPAAHAQDRPYSGGNLTAADFGGTAPPVKDREGNDAVTAAGVTSQVVEGQASGTPGNRAYAPSLIVVEAVVDTAESWNTLPTDTDLMKHEQGHFDLAQIAAKKAQAEINKALKDGKLNGKGKTVEEAVADTEKKINEIIDRYKKELKAANKAYDDATDHGRDDAKQDIEDAKLKTALQSANTDAGKKTGAEAESTTKKSIKFDAALQRLSIDENFTTGVHATNLPFVPDPNDPVLGAEVLMPTFTLLGANFTGQYFFRADGPNPAVQLVNNGVTLFRSTLDYMLFDPVLNVLFGMTGGTIAPAGISHFVDDMMANAGLGDLALFGVEFTPDQDFFALTSGFTVSAASAASNLEGFRLLNPVPLPAPWALLLLAAALMWPSAWRRQALAAQRLARGAAEGAGTRGATGATVAAPRPGVPRPAPPR